MNYADLGNEAARIEAEFLTGERDEIDYDETAWLKKESRANAPDAVKGVYAQKEAEYAEKRYNEAYNRLFGGGEVSGQYIQLQQFANIYPEAFSFETDENNNIKEIKVDTSKINADDKTKMKIKDACETVFKESVFTAAANLVGIPALVSGGVQLMGKHFSENVLLSLAGSTERVGE